MFIVDETRNERIDGTNREGFKPLLMIVYYHPQAAVDLLFGKISHSRADRILIAVGEDLNDFNFHEKAVAAFDRYQYRIAGLHVILRSENIGLNVVERLLIDYSEFEGLD